MYQQVNKKILPGARDGFTLVEVLLVIAILAMATVARVGVSNYLQTQSKIALTKQCVEILSTAVEEFYNITGHYPIDNWDDIDEVGSRLAGAEPGGTDEPVPDEVLYLQLSILPQTRAIIAKLPGKLLAKPISEATVILPGQNSKTPYLRSIVDAWHKTNAPRPLTYQRNNSGFPTIQSDGPDGKSDNEEEKLDDITNAD